MKKFICFILIICITFLLSCNSSNKDITKKDFSLFSDNKNDVVLLEYSYIHFDDHVINLNKLKVDGEYNNGLIFKKGYFYFTTARTYGIHKNKLNIYKSDLYGEDVELVFTMDGYKTYPLVHSLNNDFYVEHYLSNAFIKDDFALDKYSLDTNIYENIDGGRDCDISDYIKKEEKENYIIEIVSESSKKHDYFTINDIINDNLIKIDDDFLKTTIYYDLMNKYGYSPRQCDLSNGHILLSYSLGGDYGLDCCFLVFEYDLKNNELEYKLLAFPQELINNKVLFIG